MNSQTTKLDSTRRWVIDSGSGSSLPSPSDEDAALLNTNNNDAVITIQDEPSHITGAFCWRKFLIHMGPGFLMAIAYIDPGNFEASLQSGALTGYSLLWLLLISTACGYLLQSLSAKLGVATGRHLAQHCRDRYQAKPLRITLWIMAELAIIGSDIQEVIGAAIAMSILTQGRLPLYGGVIFAAISAYIFLFLEKLGIRWLEGFIQLLVAIMALTMGLLFFLADVPYSEVAKGFLIPKLPASALPTAAALLGSILMPHNLFLHSALVHNRAMPASYRHSLSLRENLTYYNLEAAAALFVTLMINTSVISVFAKGFYQKSLEEDIGLENAGTFLGERFGGKMKLIWAIGLLAAGQSSTMTGTYAGQHVMSGFLNLKISPFKRALVTRAVAVFPTLLVAFYAKSDSTRLDVFNQWLNILQSVQLPFVVTPLLVLTSDKLLMGVGFVNSTLITTVSWIIAALIMAVNCSTAYHLLMQETAASPALRGLFVVGIVGYLTILIVLAIYSFWPSSSSSLCGRRRDHQVVVEGDEEDEDDDVHSIVAPLLNFNNMRSPVKEVNSRPDSARSNISSHVIDDFGSLSE